MPISTRFVLNPTTILDQLLIVKHALYDGEIRLAQDTVDELILKLKAI